MSLTRYNKKGWFLQKLVDAAPSAEKKFPDLVSFELHSADGHRLRCEDQQCIARFPTERELRRHMRVEHEVFEPMPELWEAEQLLEHKYNCTKCDKKYML